MGPPEVGDGPRRQTRRGERREREPKIVLLSRKERRAGRREGEAFAECRSRWEGERGAEEILREKRFS